MDNKTDILIYQMEDGNIHVDVRLEDETVWMTQKSIAGLYQKNVRTISDHIINIYDEGELNEKATIRKNRIVRNEGGRRVFREIIFYNLDIILAIGYRVRSTQGMHFRRWATERLKEYLVKGFTMNDQRLKEMTNLGQDYFDELLERIRDIRASEKRFYRKITDLYSLSIDYNSKARETKEFFAIVQNKLHFAIHGHTAAELISKRANASKDNMGLTSWTGKKVRKKDIAIAKNYLNENEIKQLNRIVTMYLDYAEDQAERNNPLYMKDWEEKINKFLQFSERDILKNAGKISKEVATALAAEEYDKYSRQRIEEESSKKNDFDDFLEENKNLK
jgi:hypothetical protein